MAWQELMGGGGGTRLSQFPLQSPAPFGGGYTLGSLAVPVPRHCSFHFRALFQFLRIPQILLFYSLSLQFLLFFQKGRKEA